MNTYLLGHAQHLIRKGRAAAAHIRQCADGRECRQIDDLIDTEFRLSNALVTARDTGELNINISLVTQWARDACRGHDMYEIAGWLMKLADDGSFSAISEIRHFDINSERSIWAPGMNNEDVEEFCHRFDRARPEPLMDIDDIIGVNA